MWRFRSSQKKSVASVASYVRKRTGKADFNPPLQLMQERERLPSILFRTPTW